MFSALLLFLVPAIALGQFPYEIPVECGQKCVEKFQSGEQSACIRGCAISFVTKKHIGQDYPTCEQACTKEYEKSVDFIDACKKACDMTPEPMVEDNKPVSIFEWMRKLLLNAFNRAKNCMKLLKGTDKETAVKSNESVDQNKKVEEDHPFFITRIRVFQRIIPDDNAANPDAMPMMNPLKRIHYMMLQDQANAVKDQSNVELEPQHPDHVVRLMWSNQESKNDQPMMHYMSSARVSSIFKHIVVSPLILSLFIVLLLLISLITIKLVVQACHYRDARRIQYSRLPTYIEAVSVKIPYSDDEEVVEKKKPVDA